MAMSNGKKSGYWRFLWLGVAGIGLAVLIVFFLLSKPTTPDTKGVTVTIDSNGVARLGGVPLLTTNIRDGTFAAMSALEMKAGLRIPTPVTNKTQESNLIEILKSMSQAGLFSTNSTNQPPNPYE